MKNTHSTFSDAEIDTLIEAGALGDGADEPVREMERHADTLRAIYDRTRADLDAAGLPFSLLVAWHNQRGQ